MLGQRLQLTVGQKQILTPGLVQMVTVLQLTRLELKDMITQEISANPVLEENLDSGDELTPEELQAFLETERISTPADHAILEAASRSAAEDSDFDTYSSGEPDIPVVEAGPEAAWIAECGNARFSRDA